MSKVKGGDLMAFMGGKSIAYATNHTLEINGETVNTSNKDEGGGDWESSEISILSWSVNSDNLFSTDGQGNLYDDLFDAMIAKQPINLVFATKSGSATDVPTGGWTAAIPKFSGDAVITSLSLNAPNGEYATYTVQFKGVGALSRIEQ